MAFVTVTPQEAQRPLFVGVDVGGTNIKIGFLDDRGQCIEKLQIATQEPRGPADAVQRIHDAIQRQLQALGLGWHEVGAIGLGTPGTMDIPRGMIVTPPNLPHWRHFPIRDALSNACGKPVVFENDANAAAYGEFWIGSGQGSTSMILLTLGTGVGGGIIVDGELIHGVNSFGSECGHIIVDSREDARLCVWGGGRGELEAYASAGALVDRTKEVLATGRGSSLHARAAQAPLTPLIIGEEANAGDAVALEIIEEMGRYLGVGIVTLVHTIDPGMVVLGGAMTFGREAMPAGRRLLESVRAEFTRRAFDVVVNTTKIAFASLGGDAGFIGAAGLARAACQPPGSRSC